MNIFISLFGRFFRFLRKSKIWLLKKFLTLTNPEFRKRIVERMRIKKKRELISQFDILIEEGITPQMLWNLHKTPKDEMIREKSLQFFLRHPELSLEDIYEAADTIDKDDKEILKTLYEKARSLGLTPEDFVRIILEGPESFRDLAEKDFFSTIEDGRLKNSHAKRLLINLINEVPQLRMTAWCSYRKMSPTSSDLQKMLDSRWIYSMPELSRSIEEQLRKTLERERDQKKRNKKLSKKIARILKQLDKLS